MKIKARDEELNFEVKGRITVKKLLEHFSINPDTVIVSVNGTLRTPEFGIKKNDDVEFIYTISGG